MKETGLSSRIPRLHHRISSENISTKPSLSPHTIPEISLNGGEDDSGYGGSQTGLNPGRLRRHHSICVQRDKTTGTTRLASSNVSRTSSPIAGDIHKNRSPNCKFLPFLNDFTIEQFVPPEWMATLYGDYHKIRHNSAVALFWIIVESCLKLTNFVEYCQLMFYFC